MDLKRFSHVLALFGKGNKEICHDLDWKTIRIFRRLIIRKRVVFERKVWVMYLLFRTITMHLFLYLLHFLTWLVIT